MPNDSFDGDFHRFNRSEYDNRYQNLTDLFEIPNRNTFSHSPKGFGC